MEMVNLLKAGFLLLALMGFLIIHYRSNLVAKPIRKNQADRNISRLKYDEIN
jgi:hypothetical protein